MITAAQPHRTEEPMHTQDAGNNEIMVRGISELHGRFTALTFAESKTFKTRKGAVQWLRRRGYDENGKAIPLGENFA
jgi:glutamine cyclotransferase